jgi:predicted alpha/beta hydrolase family esterase
MARALVLVPGLGNSGHDHWQSHWQRAYPQASRVEQSDWNHPRLREWMENLDATVRAAEEPVVIAAHSLGCALLAHWAETHDTSRVAGALLVAPADVDSPRHTPPETRAFAPMPTRKLPFPARVVASENDPFVDFEHARALAEAWGADFVNAGKEGHLNAASGLGAWPKGQAELCALLGAESLE